MKNKNVSKAYALSLYELGQKNKTEVVTELTTLTELINQSNDLENLLFLSVFSAEEKTGIIKKISEMLKLSSLTQNFLLFLVEEERMGLLPHIFKDLIVIDDAQKGFLRGSIEGAEEKLNPIFQEKILKYLEQKCGARVELKYHTNNKMTGGYKVKVGDLQLDASLDNLLDKFKETIANI